MTRLLATCLAFVLVGIGPALAQQAVNVRGTIAAFADGVLQVTKGNGETVSVELPDAVNVAITQPFRLADVKSGMKLGVTTIRKADGTVVAIDVRPISATANVGLSPYDLQPESTMTNGIIEGVAEGPDGNVLSLDVNGQNVKALVLPSTAMSKAAPGTRADLKPGETVFVAARQDQGRLIAARVQVSKDGIKPTQ